MAVYFIIYQNITDPDRYMGYVRSALPVIERRGGRLVAQGMPEAIEGTVTWQRAFVFEWPSRQDFLAYWHSDEYAEIKKLREGAAEWQAVIVEGVQLQI